ncbi:MAG: BRCT domain-containing protein [Pirellulales bacterium]
MLNEDNAEYFKYTGPARLDKAIHTLAGMLQGITADGEVTPDELRVLSGWVYRHREFINRHPFSEIIPVLWKALEDRHLSQEEQDDLIWLCQRLSAEQGYYDVVTADMQQLHGIMAGISFDGRLTEAELQGVRGWTEDHEHLKTLWPYDEFDALIIAVLADGKIDPAEHKELLSFFSDFARTTGHQSVSLKSEELTTVRGIYAVDPRIEFPERLFCFTGKSERANRAELAELIVSKGGDFNDRVVLDTDYLIVGADGNPCWAYACYGRKIEEAVALRKNGHPLLIVHEYDFWDFV